MLPDNWYGRKWLYVSGLFQDIWLYLLLHLLLKPKAKWTTISWKGDGEKCTIVLCFCRGVCDEKRNKKEPKDVCIVSSDFVLGCFPREIYLLKNCPFCNLSVVWDRCFTAIFTAQPLDYLSDWNFFVCSQQHPVNPEIKDFLDKRECVVCVFQPCVMCLFEQNFPLPPFAT